MTYSFENPGNILTIRVFDPRGRPVRNLAINHLAGTEGIITWDGLTDNQTLARAGMYLLITEIFDQRGNTRIIKGICILSRKYL
jgi:hypothetical protein